MGIVWSEKAGAVLSIHHTHPKSIGKTPALCKKKKLGSRGESDSVQGTVWRWEIKSLNKNLREKKKNLAHVVSLIVFERCGGGKFKTSQERRVGCAQK